MNFNRQFYICFRHVWFYVTDFMLCNNPYFWLFGMMKLHLSVQVVLNHHFDQFERLLFPKCFCSIKLSGHYLFLNQIPKIAQNTREYCTVTEFTSNNPPQRSALTMAAGVTIFKGRRPMISQIIESPLFSLLIREGWWDGSKSHRRRRMTRVSICIWNWDGSKFEEKLNSRQ